MQVVSKASRELLLNRVDKYNQGSTYIELDQVEVPVANLLGAENKGFPVIMNSMLLFDYFFDFAEY